MLPKRQVRHCVRSAPEPSASSERRERAGAGALVHNAFAGEQQVWKLAQRGVRVFQDYRTMLETCHAQLDLLVGQFQRTGVMQHRVDQRAIDQLQRHAHTQAALPRRHAQQVGAGRRLDTQHFGAHVRQQ